MDFVMNEFFPDAHVWKKGLKNKEREREREREIPSTDGKGHFRFLP